jgi:SAM-dependent methyltransferase
MIWDAKDRTTIWESILCCPVDRSPLETQNAEGVCSQCGFRTSSIRIGDHNVPDYRALDHKQTYTINFRIPGTPLNRKDFAARSFQAIQQDFQHYSRAQIRHLFGTKIDKGIQYYCQQALREFGASALILDLGCGSGGNRRYLESLGFKNVLCVDWSAAGADLLVDAHRLPLHSGAFDLIICTAVFEHLYNPFVAIAEVARVLKVGGYFVGGASFWEAWHGSSHFHLTPDGWNALFNQAGLEWIDFWTGWGIIPAALTHVLIPGHLRSLGYALQSGVEAVYRLVLGTNGVQRLQLRASGSYMVCAHKKKSIE